MLAMNILNLQCTNLSVFIFLFFSALVQRQIPSAILFVSFVSLSVYVLPQELCFLKKVQGVNQAIYKY